MSFMWNSRIWHLLVSRSKIPLKMVGLYRLLSKLALELKGLDIDNDDLDNLYNKIKPSIKYLIAIVLLSLFVIDNIYCHNKPNIGEGITTYKSDCNLEAKIL